MAKSKPLRLNKAEPKAANAGTALDRLSGVRQILSRSNAVIGRDREGRKSALATGFEPMRPSRLLEAARWLLNGDLGTAPKLSLDLGCGNGGWALMAAAAGFRSFGIDVNPYLIDQARQNLAEARTQGLIDAQVECRFGLGNIYPGEYLKEFCRFASRQTDSEQTTLPCQSPGDAYADLGISVCDAGIIYCFPWENQMPFLSRFLDREARPDAVFVLPLYGGWLERIPGYAFQLERVASPGKGRTFIGRRRGRARSAEAL